MIQKNQSSVEAKLKQLPENKFQICCQAWQMCLKAWTKSDASTLKLTTLIQENC